MKRPMLVEQKIRIKAYEIDAMGIVSNIVYVKWFEDLRHLFLDTYYPYAEMMEGGKSPMLMKTQVEYKNPLTIHDEPTGRLWVSRFGRTKWEMQFEIASGETLHCTGSQTGCFYDVRKNGVTVMPDSLWEAYNREVS